MAKALKDWHWIVLIWVFLFGWFYSQYSAYVDLFILQRPWVVQILGMVILLAFLYFMVRRILEGAGDGKGLWGK